MHRPRSFAVAFGSPVLTFQTLIAAVICLGSVGCREQEREKASFHIVATDAAFEAPDKVPAGLRHILFENHGAEIHESMLVKLATGMSTNDYVAQVKKGGLFPLGGRDYSGPGLTGPAKAWNSGPGLIPAITSSSVGMMHTPAPGRSILSSCRTRS
jgi:hypothetical protein